MTKVSDVQFDALIEALSARGSESVSSVCERMGVSGTYAITMRSSASSARGQRLIEVLGPVQRRTPRAEGRAAAKRAPSALSACEHERDNRVSERDRIAARARELDVEIRRLDDAIRALRGQS